MSKHENEETEKMRTLIRNRYGDIAQKGSSCCSSSCCGDKSADKAAVAMGYNEADLATLPSGANMGLSCGNPLTLASLKLGETVLDLGSGGGFDVFLAGQKVGARGHVIGVDMTHEMLSKARNNIKAYKERTGFDNVEFRLGEIEYLPVADDSVDVIISNCVVNLSQNKRQVLEEAFRVLRPGGRLAISDIVASAPMPESILRNEQLACSCISGAAMVDQLEKMLVECGFEDVKILQKEESRTLINEWIPGTNAGDYVVSAMIEAVKPYKFSVCS